MTDVYGLSASLKGLSDQIKNLSICCLPETHKIQGQ